MARLAETSTWLAVLKQYDLEPRRRSREIHAVLGLFEIRVSIVGRMADDRIRVLVEGTY